MHNYVVDFDHFHILRAIGKGAFGKVSKSYKFYPRYLALHKLQFLVIGARQGVVC